MLKRLIAAVAALSAVLLLADSVRRFLAKTVRKYVHVDSFRIHI